MIDARLLERREAFQPMKVRSLAGHRYPGEMAARRAPTMDGVGIGGDEAGRQRRALDPRATRPAIRVDLRRVLDGEITRDDTPPPGKPQREIVAMRSELELEVLLVAAEQEELDDLVVPESVAAPGRSGRRQIIVVRSLDLDLDRITEPELDASELVHAQGLVVPGPAKLEAEAFHA